MDSRLRWALICSFILSVINFCIFFYLRPSLTESARRPAVAKLDSVEGRVEILDSVFKSWRTGRDGAPLEAGTTIRSGPSARAKLVFAQYGDTVLIEPNSTIVVDQSVGKNRIEIISGQVRTDKNQQQRIEISRASTNATIETGRSREAKVSDSGNFISNPVAQGVPNVSDQNENQPMFVWTFPDKDIRHESKETHKPLEVAWEPLADGTVEIWSGLTAENLKPQAKVASEAGKTSITPPLGRSFIQGRFLKSNSSPQFGPLIEVRASVSRSFFVVAPNIDQSIVLNADKPSRMEFAWTASDEFEKFLLTIKSKDLGSPLIIEIPGDKREHTLSFDQAGSYHWNIKALAKNQNTRIFQQSGHFNLIAIKRDWFSIERVEPQESILRSFGQNGSLKLRWRLLDDRGADVSDVLSGKNVKTATYRQAKRGQSEKVLYQVEVSSKKSGEQRKFNVEKQELTIPRIDAGELGIRIQAYSAAGVEVSRPLEFGVEVLEVEAPRWPAGIEHSLGIKEIRPGTFEASWMAPSAPAQYHVILKRDGQLVESFETSEKKHVLKKLLPGRYRFEVIARGLRGEYELSPLTETWTVQSESAVPAPQLKKIEVRQ